jgi:hypothetical protein
MTNDPRRGRDDAAGSPGPHLEAVPGPPGQNGRNPSKADGPARIGQAVAAALAEVLPGMLMNAFGQVLSSVQVRTAPLKCSTCFVIQARWAQQHAAEIQAASQAMVQALAPLAPDDPRRGQVSVLMFLPPHLHPGAGEEGMPQVQGGITMVAGTLVCPAHHPEVPQPGSGRPALLIATTVLPSQMLAEMARA